MTKDEMANFMEEKFTNFVMKLREEGQREYAQEEDNAFANFERGAKELNLNRKQILWVYAMKHKDGISSFLKGHTSQREAVDGRIGDLIVYLFLLWGMIEQERTVLAKVGVVPL